MAAVKLELKTPNFNTGNQFLLRLVTEVIAACGIILAWIELLCVFTNYIDSLTDYLKRLLHTCEALSGPIHFRTHPALL